MIVSIANIDHRITTRFFFYNRKYYSTITDINAVTNNINIAISLNADVQVIVIASAIVQP